MLGAEMPPHKSSCLCTSAASIVILRRRNEPNPMGARKYILGEIGDSGMTNNSKFIWGRFEAISITILGGRGHLSCEAVSTKKGQYRT